MTGRLPAAYAGRRRRATAGRRETVPAAEVRALGLRPNADRARDFPPMAEDATFLPLVRAAAAARGLGCYHTGISIGSDTGFPDLTLWGPGGFAVRELKGSAGRVYRDQLDTILGLRDAGADAGLWWPEDHYLGVVGEVLDRLAGPPRPGLARAMTPRGPGVVGRRRTADGRRRAACGCPIDDDGRIGVHTCPTWGPPAAKGTT